VGSDLRSSPAGDSLSLPREGPVSFPCRCDKAFLRPTTCLSEARPYAKVARAIACLNAKRRHRGGDEEI